MAVSHEQEDGPGDSIPSALPTGKSPPESGREDPIVTSARREAIMVLGWVAVAMTYTISVCHSMGYGAEQHELKFVRLFAGIAFPDWIFWGIVVPWVVCFVVGGMFAFGFMKDADMGEELDEEDDILAGASSPAESKEGGNHA